MDQEPNPRPPTEQGQDPALTRPTKAQRLAYQLHQPGHRSQRTAPISSPLSESGIERNLDAVLGILTTRMEQVAHLSEEQWERVEGVLAQMNKTLELMEVIIGNQDEMNEIQRDYVERLGIAIQALMELDQNMSEFLAYQQQKDQSWFGQRG